MTPDFDGHCQPCPDLLTESKLIALRIISLIPKLINGLSNVKLPSAFLADRTRAVRISLFFSFDDELRRDPIGDIGSNLTFNTKLNHRILPSILGDVYVEAVQLKRLLGCTGQG